MNYYHNLKKKDGFTIIESIMVIMILGVISAIASKPLLQGYTAYQTNKNIINAGWQYRYSLERMARELRSISGATSISTATATTITFLNTSSQTITYTLTGTQIMRKNSAGLNSDQILADGITNASLFDYYDTNGVLMTAPVTGVNLLAIRYVKINLNINLNNTNISLSTAVFTRFAS